ncbi:MAG: amidase domain-containing protein [Bacillota bacterium]|nr:amidase domain-containing protein [Bacillota bacterium]
MRKMIRFIYVFALLLVSIQVVIADSGMPDESTLIVLEKEIPEIEHNGGKQDLFIQYKNREEALNYMLNKHSKLFDFIKSEYTLEAISMYNWSRYYEILHLLDQTENTMTQRYPNEIAELNKFFDVFENTDKNAEILQLVNGNGEGAENNNQQLQLLLPYTASSDIQPKTTIAIDLEDAVAYAETYANSPNYSDYTYFSGADCTNFVSQILSAGGVSQNVYDSEFSGWWHKKVYYQFGNVYHKHSISWIRASTFADYMGVSYTTRSHYRFSRELTKGDVIGYDVAGDGDFEHMAFVTDKDSYASNYSGKTYYDYKVAQHTNNYLRWTSSSLNKWETLEDEGYTYGIIRR